MSEQEDRRAAGMAKMQEVYGFTVDPADLPGRYTDVTVDHLFGTIWTDDTIDLRDRRMLDHRRPGGPGQAGAPGDPVRERARGAAS